MLLKLADATAQAAWQTYGSVVNMLAGDRRCAALSKSFVASCCIYRLMYLEVHQHHCTK